MYISILGECMDVYYMLAWSPWMSGESIRSLWTRVMDDSEPPCGSWTLNPGSRQEQPLLLTAEPPLQSLLSFLMYKFLHKLP